MKYLWLQNLILLKWLLIGMVCVLTAQSCPTLCDPVNCNLPGSSVHGILQARTGVGCHFLLQGILPTQGLNPDLPRSKRLLISWICTDFGAPKNKVWHCFHCFPIYFPWSDGTRCHDLSLLTFNGLPNSKHPLFNLILMKIISENSYLTT